MKNLGEKVKELNDAVALLVCEGQPTIYFQKSQA